MLIDWFTVLAQAINFLILVWLMKRFLYRPILHAIDEREKKIAAELADADAKKAEARKERNDFERKNAEFDQQKSELFSQATEDAKAERQRLIEQARQAADSYTTIRQESLRIDARNLDKAFIQRTQQEVFSIARKALIDLAGVSLEERMCETFTDRLRDIDGMTKARLTEALKSSSDPAIVRSAFQLSESQRQKIQQTFNEIIAKEILVRFETAPDVICGIELTINGQKIAWSLADYLSSLEENVDQILNNKQMITPGAESNSKDTHLAESRS